MVVARTVVRRAGRRDYATRPTGRTRYDAQPPRRVKLTGERPIEGQTPDSLLALHAAGYREVRDRVGPGRFLDLGCGLGDGTAGFAAEDRTLVGVDYDPATAAEARPRSTATSGLATRLRRRRGAADPHRLVRLRVLLAPHRALRRSASTTSREVARVLADDGAAFFITPNEPADFENPYHVYLFEPDDLRRCSAATSARSRCSASTPAES